MLCSPKKLPHTRKHWQNACKCLQMLAKYPSEGFKSQLPVKHITVTNRGRNSMDRSDCGQTSLARWKWESTVPLCEPWGCLGQPDDFQSSSPCRKNIRYCWRGASTRCRALLAQASRGTVDFSLPWLTATMETVHCQFSSLTPVHQEENKDKLHWQGIMVF